MCMSMCISACIGRRRVLGCACLMLQAHLAGCVGAVGVPGPAGPAVLPAGRLAHRFRRDMVSCFLGSSCCDCCRECCFWQQQRGWPLAQGCSAEKGSAAPFNSSAVLGASCCCRSSCC